MPAISVIINCDTRPQNDNAEHTFSGTVNEDFLIDGVLNKKKFFEGFDFETIVCIDKHQEIPIETLKKLYEIADTVCVRNHTDEKNFNDYNYLRALYLGSGDLICHIDQDTACFTSSKEYVQQFIDLTETQKFVCYPSHWTPTPVHDESFQNKWWASTRFFMCKRKWIQFEILEKCIKNPDWAYAAYGDVPRKCNWLEHFLALVNEHWVFYPPVELHKGAIFSWKTYKTGTLLMLNNWNYESVKQWILHRGGIQYPVDVNCE